MTGLLAQKHRNSWQLNHAAHLPHPITVPVPRYHFKTAYTIPLDQADSIVFTSVYYREHFDSAVIRFTPRTHTQQQRNVRLICLPLTDDTTRELDRLPFKLTEESCLRLDIMSIFHLRQTNTRGRSVINALHKYRTVTTHAINPFCVLLRTHSASRVTLPAFYRLFYTQISAYRNTQSAGELAQVKLSQKVRSGQID